jgi:FtsP/CotA-like multicopper oxidase with cupredoxin domain
LGDRDVLSSRIVVVFLVLAGFFPVGQGRAQTATLSDPPPLLRQMPEISSVKGVLTAVLEATPQALTFGEVTVEGLVFNSDYAGPVLRAHPGDIMKIKLINHVALPINLHFHGILTSPQGNSDNVVVSVAPGASFDYEIKVPASQSPGIYWYHTHIHGISEREVMSGLSGALIVEGIQERSPQLANIKENILVLKDVDLSNDEMKASVKSDPYFHKLIQTINGQIFSRIPMRAGETQLWRFSNQSADFYFNLSLAGHKFRIIAADGSPTDKEAWVDKIRIGPASRLEALVDAGEPGTYDLVSEGVLSGSGADKKPDRILGQVVVSGSAAPFEPKLSVPLVSVDLGRRNINARREIVFSNDPSGDKFLINGRIFDHDRIDARVPLGNVEEWTIRNDSDDMHIFHIHQVNFQVTEINGKAQPYTGNVDNMRVPERGSIKILIAFTDPVIVGRFVYHCHVLWHEDKGMMATIEVYDPAKEGAIKSLWDRLSPVLWDTTHYCASKSQSAWTNIARWIKRVEHRLRQQVSAG